MTSTTAPTAAVERINQELLSLPINTLPDHEYLLHGRYSDDRSHPTRLRGRITIQEWRDTVERQVEQIKGLGEIAIERTHLLCMEVADGMESFE